MELPLMSFYEQIGPVNSIYFIIFLTCLFFHLLYSAVPDTLKKLLEKINPPCGPIRASSVTGLVFLGLYGGKNESLIWFSKLDAGLYDH
jgi:hypothetical protein